MFLNLEEHYDFFRTQIALKPSTIFISTFGIYGAILDDGRDAQEWGPKFESLTRKMIDLMEPFPDVRILVGLNRYMSCKGDFQCDDCAQRYLKSSRRLIRHQEKWPNFKWRFSPECHLKCYLFFYGQQGRVSGIAGGRNFADSQWADVTFPLTSKQVLRLHTHISNIWTSSPMISEETISKEVIRQINSVRFA